MLQSSIHPTAQIGTNVVIGAYAVIGERVTIGPGTVIGNGCVLHDDTKLGSNVRVLDNAVLGRVPVRVASMTREITNQLPPLVIESGSVVGAGVVLYRGTSVGENTLIGDLASIREECSVGSDCIIARLVSVNYETKIGRRVKVMDNSHITGNMIIEDGVFISVLVSTTNDNNLGRTKHQGRKFHGPTIRRGASIGAGASILPSITVGEYAIVGAGSLVCRNVPPRKVVVGVPARVVKDVPPEMLPDEQ